MGWSLIAAAVVGVGVALAANAIAGDSCSAHDPLGFVSSCRGLISSLAVRVGAVAGAAVLLMQLTMAGLLRTAEAMEDERRLLDGEATGPSDAPTR